MPQFQNTFTTTIKKGSSAVHNFVARGLFEYEISTALCMGCGSADVHSTTGHLHEPLDPGGRIVASWCDECCERGSTSAVILSSPPSVGCKVGGGCCGKWDPARHGLRVSVWEPES